MFFNGWVFSLIFFGMFFVLILVLRFFSVNMFFLLVVFFLVLSVFYSYKYYKLFSRLEKKTEIDFTMSIAFILFLGILLMIYSFFSLFVAFDGTSLLLSVWASVVKFIASSICLLGGFEVLGPWENLYSLNGGFFSSFFYLFYLFGVWVHFSSLWFMMPGVFLGFFSFVMFFFGVSCFFCFISSWDLGNKNLAISEFFLMVIFFLLCILSSMFFYFLLELSFWLKLMIQCWGLDFNTIFMYKDSFFCMMKDSVSSPHLSSSFAAEKPILYDVLVSRIQFINSSGFLSNISSKL